MNTNTFNSITLLLTAVILIIGCASDKEEDTHVKEAQRATAQSYDAIGVVKSITPSKNYVNIDHEAITGLMDAMAMFFPVSDTSILRNIVVDDSVAFTLKVIDGKMGIEEIQVLE